MKNIKDLGLVMDWVKANQDTIISIMKVAAVVTAAGAIFVGLGLFIGGLAICHHNEFHARPPELFGDPVTCE